MLILDAIATDLSELPSTEHGKEASGVTQMRNNGRHGKNKNKCLVYSNNMVRHDRLQP